MTAKHNEGIRDELHNDKHMGRVPKQLSIWTQDVKNRSDVTQAEAFKIGTMDSCDLKSGGGVGGHLVTPPNPKVAARGRRRCLTSQGGSGCQWTSSVVRWDLQGSR
jgi:hypothetical protein